MFDQLEIRLLGKLNAIDAKVRARAWTAIGATAFVAFVVGAVVGRS